MRVSQINRALSLPRLSYGVSAQALGMCWGPAALAVVFVGTSVGWIWSLIPIGYGLIVHAILRWTYRKDYRIFDMYKRYSQLNDEYHPNAREKLPVPFERPYKVGRGLRV